MNPTTEVMQERLTEIREAILQAASPNRVNDVLSTLTTAELHEIESDLQCEYSVTLALASYEASEWVAGALIIHADSDNLRVLQQRWFAVMDFLAANDSEAEQDEEHQQAPNPIDQA